MQQETRQCQNCKNQFTIELDDFAFYEKMQVPAPTFCPTCRLIRRLAWAGQRILYKRKCDFTGDNVISIHRPDIKQKVYRQDIWWSDRWDPKQYGRDYDFSKSFFEQWRDLFESMPLPSLYTEYTSMVNSDYCNAAATLKNCYLCFRADGSEDCAYCTTISGMKNSYDISFSNFCELSYGSFTLEKCNKVFFSQDCEECHDVWFSEDLRGCTNCIGCIGLRNKSYHIFNKPYSKEEYQNTIKNFDFGSVKFVEDFKKKAKDFTITQPHKEFHGLNIQSSSGDYLRNCRNVNDSFMVGNSEHVRYGTLLKAGPAAQCYDYTMFALKAEWIYECAWVGINVNNVKFGIWDYKCHDLEYCYGCHGSGNLFGCVGIRAGEYCILNKQYTKQKYLELLPKIKEQMAKEVYVNKKGREYKYGEFLPAEFSPWAYNETYAYEWFPMTKEESLSKGFNWKDKDEREFQTATITLPDHIKDLPLGADKEILKCASCGMNYRLIPREIDFYKKFNIPVPRECPLCRDIKRTRSLNPMQLFDRNCTKCGKNIKTSYSPDRPEIVYCEQCYNAEVI